MLAASLIALAAVTAPAPVLSVVVSRALQGAPAGGARAAAATAPLLGHPYQFSPLGEEAGPDPDPRFRLDAFDCMTFAETAVALASAETLAEARRALDDIRYEGAPVLSGRHHEVLSQWLPANVARGWVREITAEVAPGLVRRAEKVYTPAAWDEIRRAGRGIPGLPRASQPLGVFGVDVISAEDVPGVADRIPVGTLAFLVRADAPDRATRVSHVGLVVLGPGGERRVRHATSTREVERVIEEPLDRFLRREQRARPAWPVTGLALFAIQDNRAHLAETFAGLAPGGPGGARVSP